MTRLFQKKSLLIIAILIAGVCVFIYSTRRQTIDYNTQVKPIFNKNCITCHGGIRRKAGFSLLFRSEALANTESGKPAIWSDVRTARRGCRTPVCVDAYESRYVRKEIPKENIGAATVCRRRDKVGRIAFKHCPASIIGNFPIRAERA